MFKIYSLSLMVILPIFSDFFIHEQSFFESNKWTYNMWMLF